MVKKSEQSTPHPRLSDERLRRGWSQQDVADELGTTRITISRWEQGSTFPSPHFRQKLSLLFGKTAGELGLIPEDAEKRPELPQTSTGQDVAPPISAPSTQHPAILPSPIWNVPYRRNPFFTGRQGVLERLHDVIHANKAAALTQPQALSGLGGIGKTQTAAEYAYRYHDDYQAVLWVQADTPEILVSQLIAIAIVLNLPMKDERDQNRIVDAVKQWLRDHSDWLLIFDNADDVTVVKDFVLPAYAGHILLTTRAQATGRFAQHVELEKMEPAEGALFLLRRASIIAAEASLDEGTYADLLKAQEIAEALDGLPLALDQAGAYIEETACSLSGYLDLYRTRRTALLKRRGRLVSEHPQSVATTWSLCFEKVELANPAAAELLRLCAFLHPDAIPEEIITEVATELGPLLQAVATDAFELNAAIEELRAFSLIRRDAHNKTLTIHRLVQAVLKDAMSEEAQQYWAERTVRAVNRAFPDVTYESWDRCQRYLPHAQICASLIERHHLYFPEAGQLLNQTGEYVFHRALYTEVEPLLQQALTIREQVMGPEHALTAQSLNILALFYLHQGPYEQAEPLLKRALAIREQALGSEHAYTAVSLGNLAKLYRLLGKYEQAEPLAKQAVAIFEQTLGSEHPRTSNGLVNLALLYYDQGKYKQAEPLLKRALAIREQALGPDHPDTSESLNDLALLYCDQDQFEKAEPLMKRALTIRGKSLGIEHPDTITTRKNYADLLRKMGREGEAAVLEEHTPAM